MNRTLRLLLLLSAVSAICFALTGVARAQVVVGMLNEDEFRAAHPMPANVDTLRAAFERIEREFEAAARDGASATIEVHEADGTVIRGFDEYRYGTPHRAHERREHFEAFAVGDRVCTRRPLDAPWQCEEGAYIYSIHEPDWPALVSGSERRVACGDETCIELDLLFARTLELPFGSATVRAFHPDANERGTRVVVTATKPGMRPVSFVRIDHEEDGSKPSATYRYDLEAKVGELALPE